MARQLYGQIFEDAYSRARQSQQDAIRNNLAVEQMKLRRAEQLYRQQQQELKAQQYLQADAEANRYANMVNPPAAVAVDPAANAARDTYFTAHPMETPGPALPFTGGRNMLRYLPKQSDPNSLPERRFRYQQERDASRGGGNGYLNDEATVEGLARKIGDFSASELKSPEAKWELGEYDPANPEAAFVPRDNGTYARVTVPGKNPAIVKANDFRAFDSAWTRWQTKRNAQGKITSYGYQSDPYGDSASLGRGAYNRPTGAWNNPLTPQSVALSPDVERRLKEQGLREGGEVELQLDDGTVVRRKWDDRTMQDPDATRRFGKPLTGRFDLYSPNGVNPLEGRSVVRATPVPAAANVPDQVFKGEEEALAAGKKPGDVIMVINPRTGKPTRARIE